MLFEIRKPLLQATALILTRPETFRPKEMRQTAGLISRLRENQTTAWHKSCVLIHLRGVFPQNRSI
jgi:hypothetical protein